MPNLAQDLRTTQGEVVQFPKKEQKAMSIKQDGFTGLPNFICDEGYLSALSGEAIKCLILLNRHITGFRLGEKALAESLIMKITGINDKRTIRKKMDELAQFQLVRISKSKGKTTRYSLTFGSRLPVKLVASDVPSASNVVTCRDTSLVASDVPSTSDTPCHPIKEIDLKENSKISNENSAPEKFEPQNRPILQFIEYHVDNFKDFTLRELTQVYPVQSDFIEQAKISFPNLTDAQIQDEIRKLAQWSVTAEKRCSQKWMTTWLNWLKNIHETPSKNKSEKPAAKKVHRYGQGVINP